MNLHRALCLLIPLTLTTACIDQAPDDEMVSETDNELSFGGWGYTGVFASSEYAAQAATLNGVTYMVHTGLTDTSMYWRKRTGVNSWSLPVLIPGQKTSDQVSLAAFNGYLYMVHVGESDQSAVWYSRFDPITETWTPNQKLALQANTGAPALAEFDGRLWIVGGTEVADNTYQLWVSTMNTSEQITPQTSLMRKYVSGRVSLAVYANKLFMAYASNNYIYTMTHASGAVATSWSSASGVKAAPSSTTSQGYDPKIAVAGNKLHLVYRMSVLTTNWTTWDQCSWAPETHLANSQSNHAPSLTAGGPGLVLLRDLYQLPYGYGGPESYQITATEYTAPLSNGLPSCGVVVGP